MKGKPPGRKKSMSQIFDNFLESLGENKKDLN
jgi:hypothetical protein